MLRVAGWVKMLDTGFWILDFGRCWMKKKGDWGSGIEID